MYCKGIFVLFIGRSCICSLTSWLAESISVSPKGARVENNDVPSAEITNFLHLITHAERFSKEKTGGIRKKRMEMEKNWLLSRKQTCLSSFRYLTREKKEKIKNDWNVRQRCCATCFLLSILRLSDPWSYYHLCTFFHPAHVVTVHINKPISYAFANSIYYLRHCIELKETVRRPSICLSFNNQQVCMTDNRCVLTFISPTTPIPHVSHFMNASDEWTCWPNFHYSSYICFSKIKRVKIHVISTILQMR